MPNTRISDLTAATSVAGTDVYPSVQTAGVGPVKTSLTQITAFALANAPAGAVATPSIAPTGDTNTGFWFPAADTIAASTNGSERLRITSAGNVGIGTTSPIYPFEVSASSNATIRLTLAASHNVTLNAIGGGAFTIGLDGSGGTTERMRITSAGNVGIGTTSPADLLELSRSSANNVWMRVSNTSQTNQYLTVNMCGSTAFSIPGWDNSGVIEATANSVGSGTRGLVLSAFNGPIIFQTDTGRAERMRITSAGNVGIGTTSPSSRLHVVSSAALIANFQGPANTYVDYTDGTGTLRLQLLSNEPYIASIGAYPLRFAPNNSEAMRITSAGDVLIGTQTNSNNSKLFVRPSATNIAIASQGYSGDTTYAGVLVGKFDNDTTTSQVFIRFTINNNTGGSGQINANGASSAAFGSFSDRRLKTNIVDLPSQLANILALKPVEFDFIESEGGGHQIGFVAQDMEQVYPDVVGPRQDGMLMITGWSKTEARIVKAIQELAAEVAALKGASNG